MSGISCPTADALFEECSNATVEYFEAADTLSVLVGRHEEFAKAKKHCDEISARCHTARRALEQHWEEHRCRVQQPPTE